MKFWQKAVFLGLVAAAVCILLINYNGAQPTTRITFERVTTAPAVNLLVMGCDASGVRPDSILLVHIDSKENKVSLLSLPRDSKMKQMGKTRKLNTLLSGDVDDAVKTVEQLTGTEITYYIKLKVGVFAQMVDALGGLEYTVEQDMHYSDPTQNLYIDLKAGKQTLTGNQCEQYCRYRSYAMGDLTRTKHQQKLLTELVRQKSKLQYVVKIPAVFHIIKENTQTDITGEDIAAYLPLARAMAEGNVNIASYDCPGEFNDMEKEGVSYYLIDRDALRSLCKEQFSVI